MITLSMKECNIYIPEDKICMIFEYEDRIIINTVDGKKLMVVREDFKENDFPNKTYDIISQIEMSLKKK